MTVLYRSLPCNYWLRWTRVRHSGTATWAGRGGAGGMAAEVFQLGGGAQTKFALSAESKMQPFDRF